MSLEFIEVKSKKEILNHKCSILELFEESFGKRLSEEFWDWAYIGNPCGAPFVSLCYDGDVLAGHYAAIPIQLIKDGKEILAMLSMTTMVGNNYRGKGLFTKQAEIVYSFAEKEGIQLVLGFPNQNSAPGFIKRLEWVVNIDSRVARASGSQLKKSEEFRQMLVQEIDSMQLSLTPEYIQWRLKKPQTDYEVISNDLIIKSFNDTKDIVYLTEAGVDLLENEVVYNVFLTKPIKNLPDASVFQYMFGARSFNENIDVRNIKSDLLMSDVF